MIYTVTLNPALDKTARVDSFTLDAVNRVVSYRQDPGGKGINVSKVIAKLGGTSKALALLGGATGKAISQMLSEQGLDCWSINASGETRTNLKIVDPVADTHTDINEPGPEVAEKDLETVLRYLTREIEKDDIVRIINESGRPMGVGCTNYSSQEARSLIGDRDRKPLIHYDYLYLDSLA